MGAWNEQYIFVTLFPVPDVLSENQRPGFLSTAPMPGKKERNQATDQYVLFGW